MSGQYHRPHRWAWWTERPGYMRFMIRELTSVFMAGYLVVFVMTLARVGAGEALAGASPATIENLLFGSPHPFAEWIAMMRSPGWMAAHAVALAAAVWHAVTFFGAVPQAMPIFLGEKRLPAPVAMIVMGYGPWLTVTAVILWWVLR